LQILIKTPATFAAVPHLKPPALKHDTRKGQHVRNGGTSAARQAQGADTRHTRHPHTIGTPQGQHVRREGRRQGQHPQGTRADAQGSTNTRTAAYYTQLRPYSPLLCPMFYGGR